MKKYILFFYLISFSIFKLYADEIQAEFFFDDKIMTLKEGDIVVGTLRAWPIENAKKEEFEKYLGKNLFDGFYLSDIISSAPSANNADVYELKGHFIIVGKVNPEKMVFTYENSSAHVRYREVLFKPLENKVEDFYILDQSIDRNILLGIIAFAFLLLSSFLIYRYKEKIKNLFKKKTPVDPIETYRKLFQDAKERKDFERVYAEKELWLSLLETKAPAHYEFLKVINQHQYKKEWSKVDLAEVQESFDIIRRSFK